MIGVFPPSPLAATKFSPATNAHAPSSNSFQTKHVTKWGGVTGALSLVKRTPQQRQAKIENHLHHIEGLAPVLDTFHIAHTAKEASRGLRGIHRARSFGWVAASTGAWVASAAVAPVCPPAVIPLTAVAATLSAVVFAEEWRTSERMLHRQRKNELIRTNQGAFHIPSHLASPEATVVKKTYLTAKQARNSFKSNFLRVLNEHPELHPNVIKVNPFALSPPSLAQQQNSLSTLTPKSLELSFEIPFYRKRHRFSCFTPYPDLAKALFAQSCQQYEHLIQKGL